MTVVITITSGLAQSIVTRSTAIAANAGTYTQRRRPINNPKAANTAGPKMHAPPNVGRSRFSHGGYASRASSRLQYSRISSVDHCG
jgi:hypothetical protein